MNIFAGDLKKFLGVRLKEETIQGVSIAGARVLRERVIVRRWPTPQKVESRREHDGKRESKQSATIERPSEILSEQVHRARPVHHQAVITENLEKKVQDFFVFGVESLGSDIEGEAVVMKRAGQSTDHIVALDDGHLLFFLEDRVGEGETGHAGTHY